MSELLVNVQLARDHVAEESAAASRELGLQRGDIPEEEAPKRHRVRNWTAGAVIALTGALGLSADVGAETEPQTPGAVPPVEALGTIGLSGFAEFETQQDMLLEQPPS